MSHSIPEAPERNGPVADSRISGLHRRSVAERLDALQAAGFLSEADASALKHGRFVLSLSAADRMIENVISTFGLPLAVAPNFRINGRDCVVPLVVEEPSIVAGLSMAAALARRADGFTASIDESLLIGQIHIVDAGGDARASIESEAEDLLAFVNETQPRLIARGGGARSIEVNDLSLEDGRGVLAVHLLVDTCDAMGANLVNTMCETLAPRLEELAGGSAALRILSNLCDRSVATAKVRYRVGDLGDLGAETRDGIVLASQIAAADPHRAATHNKGIMNGVDAVAIATGNDWRAIEAGAHAWAARDGRYTSLTRWSVDGEDLIGEISIPLKVGTVGGTLESNPAAAAALRLTGVESAGELAELMAAVGLAQNFAALRALATKGIQAGHMHLHARNLVARAGVGDHEFDVVVEELVESGEIKDWKVAEIVARRRTEKRPGVTAAGKVILLGEHAAVYGKHALAVPIHDAMTAWATPAAVSTVSIPRWGIHEQVSDATPVGRAVSLIADELGIAKACFELVVDARLPGAMGLGSSASVAVVSIRALAEMARIDVELERVNAIAFECEKLAHGTPSGVDNTIASYGQPLLFRAGEIVETFGTLPPIVVACSHQRGNTIEQVDAVRRLHDANPDRVGALFDQIDALSIDGAAALKSGDYETLGACMNLCQGLLNAIGVSTPELESMVSIARDNGATGAKLTGAGGGGSIVALCPDSRDAVEAALKAAGFRTLGAAEA